MKQYSLSFIFLVMISSLTSAQTNSAVVADSYQENNSVTFSRAEELAKDIENSYIQKLNFSERRIAIRKMDELLKMVKESRGDNGYKKGKIHTDEEMSNLLEKLKKSFPFSDQKLVLYKDAGKYNYTVNQTIAIMNVLSFSSEKAEVLGILYPRVNDKRNSYLYLSDNNFFTIRSEIVKIISEAEE